MGDFILHYVVVVFGLIKRTVRTIMMAIATEKTISTEIIMHKCEHLKQ
jgi:hypothetical protein